MSAARLHREWAVPLFPRGAVPARPLFCRRSTGSFQLRCLGSRMSRSASPRRLVPNTARLMAMPGKMTSHGAVRTYSAADCDNMRPQDGYGSGTPSPRNDSAASVSIVELSWAVASTISGARVLGRMWRAAMRSSLMPTAFAASMKGSSRNASVLERITRADVVFFDGTLFRDDEMIASGTGAKTGRRMGHMPIDGQDGSLAVLEGVAGRRVYVHVNNTNPILIEGSPERVEVERRGWEVAEDGMEIVL